MNKEQQIEEMAKKMQKCYEKNGLLNFKWFAEALYNAGYRKIENANGHNLPHEIDYLLTEFDEMGFAPTSLCDNPEGKAKLWKSALVYEIGLLLNEYAAIKEKAVKEFAERLKMKAFDKDMFNDWAGATYVVLVREIDELLKEYENGKDKD